MLQPRCFNAVGSGGVRRREAATVTAKKAYWLTPNKLNDVIYAPVKDIAFVGKKRSAAFHDCEGPVDKPGANTSTIVSPTDAQKMNFLRSLSTSSTKPAVLAVVREFHRSYIPFASHDVFPPILHNLYEAENLKFDYGKLLELAEKTTITVTEDQCRAVELETREQYKSRLWFRFRAGRITASKLKAVCSTSVASPSLSLIMGICHPELGKFRNAATRWGCEHESIAISSYKASSAEAHTNWQILPSGFVINEEKPFIGASPDSIVTCSCCGRGTVEVKVSNHSPQFIMKRLFFSVHFARKASLFRKQLMIRRSAWRPQKRVHFS